MSYELMTRQADWTRTERKLKTLAARAEKLGLEPLTWEVIREETRKVEWRDAMAYLNAGVPLMGVENWLVVEVSGFTVSLDGWRLLGKVDHLEHGNVVSRVPGADADVDLSEYRESKSYCAHCGTFRYRKSTVLVQRIADGEVLQVGSTCVKDFLGHSVAAAFRTIDALCLMADEDQESGFGRCTAWPLETVLFITMAAIQVDGWMSGGRARDLGVQSTADVVRRALGDISSEKALLREAKTVDVEKVKAVSAWVRELEATQSSDYMHNLRAACASGNVSQDHLGLACSAIAAWENHMRREAEKASRPESQWIGQPGDKFGRKLTAKDKRNGVSALPAIEATVTFAKCKEGLYGPSTIIRFATDAGEVVTWFASGYRGVKSGERYSLAGTVKKHDEYRGVKSTVVTRVQLSEVA